MHFSALDSHLFARLLAGINPNGELAGVSPPWGRLARHLAGLGPEERSRAWQAARTLCPNADAITMAVADADPEGPPPEAAAGRSATWGIWSQISRRIGSSGMLIS